MLTVVPTLEMIAEWKRIFKEYRSTLTPNRKSGTELDLYFKQKYEYQLFDDAEFRNMVSLNIMEHDFSKSKLHGDARPNIQCYKTGNVLVAIDLCSGEFHVEGENIEEVIPIHDDLFVYRGLDKEDLGNFFLVAEYIKLSKR